MAPVWAQSMIGNYRSMFKERFGNDSTLNDDEIWDICNTVFDDTDIALQDQYRVEAMMDMETNHD